MLNLTCFSTSLVCISTELIRADSTTLTYIYAGLTCIATTITCISPTCNLIMVTLKSHRIILLILFQWFALCEHHNGSAIIYSGIWYIMHSPGGSVT